MVAPIVPFVVGMLSNLAGRKEKYDASVAAASVAETEFGYAKKLEEIKSGNKSRNNFYNSLDAAASGSMFKDLSRSLIPIKTNPRALSRIDADPELRYKFNLYNKLSNLTWDVKGANANAKAYAAIASVSNITDDDWDYLNSNDPLKADKIKTWLMGNFNTIDNQNNLGQDGTHSGAILDHENLFASSQKWVRQIVQGGYEVKHSNKVINNNNDLVHVDMNIPPNLKDAVTFSLGAQYDNMKTANAWYHNTIQEFSLYANTPQAKRGSGSGAPFVTAKHVANQFASNEAESIGWALFSPIFTKKIRNDTGQVIDIVAQEFGVFSHKDLPAAAENLMKIAHDKTNQHPEGSVNESLNAEGLYFNELSYQNFLINALSVNANEHNLPGLYVSTGKKIQFGNQPVFGTSTNYLEEKFGLTPVIRQAYRDTGNSGKIAIETTGEMRQIIKEEGIAGEAFYKVFSAFEQVKGVGGFFKKILNFGDGETPEANNLVTSTLDVNLKFAQDNVIRYSTVGVGETAAVRSERIKQLRNSEKAVTMLGKIDSKNFLRNKNLAYTTITADMDSGKKSAINGARLKLLRASLVFYAAAIFQGEGGKAISDGDRILVSNALAIGNWTTVEEALGALAQFDRGMARITAKADAIAGGNPGKVWAALNIDNIIPNGNDANMIHGNNRTIAMATKNLQNKGGDIEEITTDDKSIMIDGTLITLDFLLDSANYKNKKEMDETVDYYLSKDMTTISSGDKLKLQNRRVNSSSVDVQTQDIRL